MFLTGWYINIATWSQIRALGYILDFVGSQGGKTAKNAKLSRFCLRQCEEWKLTFEIQAKCV